MGNIVIEAQKELGGIGLNILRSFKNDLIFPQRRKTPLELLRLKVRRQYALIQSLQEKVEFYSNLVRIKNQTIRKLEGILEEKDKEIQRLELKNRSLSLLQWYRPALEC